jgi:hypothetical protein
MTPSGHKFLTIPQAAAAVPMPTSTFRAVLREGDGPALTQFHKRRMVRSDLLAEWVERRTVVRGPEVRAVDIGQTAPTLADAFATGAQNCHVVEQRAAA